MSISQTARQSAIPLELKKDGLQQRQNGDWVLRFTVQASDMDDRITRAPMGTRFVAALVEVDDNEQPKEDQAPSRQDDPQASSNPDGDRRNWSEVKPSAQAAMRCDQAPFWAFLREEHKQRVTTKDDAATAVRKICGVNSRAHFNDNHVARVAWHQLDSQFQAWLARERVGA